MNNLNRSKPAVDAEEGHPYNTRVILTNEYSQPIFPVGCILKRSAAAVASEDWSFKLMYAIIRTGGRQYRAEVGALLDVEKLPYEVDHKLEISDILLIGDDDKTVIGQPLVEGASVKATVVEQFRGEKIVVFHYRQRTNYRKTAGHRQSYTRLRIDEISVK